jgi:hypothetical protein
VIVSPNALLLAGDQVEIVIPTAHVREGNLARLVALDGPEPFREYSLEVGNGTRLATM